MKDLGNSATVMRLISIKREELDRYRQDLVRLEQIVLAARDQLRVAKESERAFLEEMRRVEQTRKGLDAAEMIERRRYLTYLQSNVEERQIAHIQADEQRDQAHRSLEKAFSEMRALERLAERRLARARAERQRIEYLLADDQEITRSGYRRSGHAQH